MDFCDLCHNMLYIAVEERKLKLHCRNCQFSKTNEGNQTVCVVQSSSAEDSADYKQFMTKYIQHDPTLPRVNNIKCPKHSTHTDKSAPDEVIYIKYNPTKMKYLYHCCSCEHFWKSSE